MKRLVIIVSLLLLLTAFSPRHKITKSFSKQKTAKTIALIHHKYLYFVRLQLNNRNAFFLVDSGAASSLLDINQANDYNFKFYQTDRIFSGVGGLSGQYRVTNYKFDHDSLSLGIYPLGANLKYVVESFNDSGMPIAGVIGSDFLRNHDAIIDYKHQTLIIYN